MTLQNSINANSLTPLSVTQGGTGVSSPTNHGVLVAKGASALTTIVLTDGQLLIGSTGNDPVAASLTAGSGITITPGAGSISISASGGSSGISSIVVRKFTTSATYFPTSGMVFCNVKMVGGGGGGGGCADSTDNKVAAASGGSSSGYSESTLTAATVGASQTITVGAGGAQGTTSNGSDGGDSSFGTLVIANRGGWGQGGVFNAVQTASRGGLNVNAGTGDITSSGMPGACGFAIYNATSSIAIAGFGGSSVFGGGGSVQPLVGSGQTSSFASTGYGSGGSGAAVLQGGTQSSGNAGKSGIVIITEYIA